MAGHLVIVDGMGFVFRAYHAVRGNLSRSDGLPTNALYGFAQMLVKVVDDLKPDMCVVALDSKGKNWRHEMYPQYKANRPAPDEALVKQLDFIEPMIRAFGLPVIRQSGVEADDIIATLVAQHRADKVTIVTSDKDLLQLVGQGVELLDTLKDKRSGVAESVEKFGVEPHLVADIQGLIGDSSDNIPGVQGIGPKTAAELVQALGNLDKIYADLSRVERETVRQKLEAGRESAFLSRELARLKADVDLNGVDMTFHPHLHEAAEYLRDTLEFNTLAARLEKRRGAAVSLRFAAPTGQPAAVERQPAATSGDDGQWAGYECVTTDERWQWWLAEARKRGRVAFDTETTSLNPDEARLVGVSLALGVGEACYVPCKEQGTRNEEPGQGDLFGGGAERQIGPHGVAGLDILADVRALLADASVVKVAHNLKYDWRVMAQVLGVTPGDTGTALQELVVNFEDTLLMSACLDAGRWNHGLDDLALRHLGHGMIKYEDVCGKGKSAVTFDRVALDAATAYAAEDADATWRLFELFQKRLIELPSVPWSASLRSPPRPATRNGNLMNASGMASDVETGGGEAVGGGAGVRFVYEYVEKPLLPVLVAMEARGVRVDEPELRRLSADFAVRMAALEKEIWGAAGHEFNVQSTQQLAVVLFDELGLGTDKQKANRSTAVNVMEALLEDAEEGTPGAVVARLILEYRQLAKLRSTYTEALIEQVNPLTKRVHTTYQQIGAGTGRFSSTEPNLQNIPIRTEEGRKVRKAFVAQPGWVMVSADYSQIELRLLAHFSGSTALRKAFTEGLDIHAYTAALVRGIEVKDVSKAQRRAAKFINFGLVYGMGARSLAKQIGCSLSEAQEWIEAYFRRYEGVREYMELNKRLARDSGYVETLCGRRVWLPDIHSTNGGLRAGAERAAINAPLQGSNADVIKLAMADVERALHGKDVRLLLQVHDELVLECAPGTVEWLKTELPGVMGGVVELSVPLAVEVGSGPNWEEAH